MGRQEGAARLKGKPSASRIKKTFHKPITRVPTFHSLAPFLSVAFLSAAAAHATPLPAFPGAEGFAAHSTGGRGGDVYQVTNLHPNGPGSFLEGI